MMKEKSDANKLLGDIAFLSDFLEKDRKKIKFNFKNSVHFVELASYKKSIITEGRYSGKALKTELDDCLDKGFLKVEKAPPILNDYIKGIYNKAKLRVSNNELYTLTQKGEKSADPNEPINKSKNLKLLYLFLRSTRSRRFHAFQGEDFLRGAILFDELAKLGKLEYSSYPKAKKIFVNNNFLKMIIIEDDDLKKDEKDFLDSYRKERKNNKSPPLFKSTRIGEKYLVSKLDEIIEELIGEFKTSHLNEYTILNLYCSDITEKLLREQIAENSEAMNYKKIFSDVLDIAKIPEYIDKKSEIFVNYPSLFFDDALEYAKNNNFQIYISFDFYSYLKINKFFEKDQCPFEIFENELETFFQHIKNKLIPLSSNLDLNLPSESLEGFYLWNYGLLSQGPRCYEECKTCKNEHYKDGFESNDKFSSWIKLRKNLVNENLDKIKKSLQNNNNFPETKMIIESYFHRCINHIYSEILGIPHIYSELSEEEIEYLKSNTNALAFQIFPDDNFSKILGSEMDMLRKSFKLIEEKFEGIQLYFTVQIDSKECFKRFESFMKDVELETEPKVVLFFVV